MNDPRDKNARLRHLRGKLMRERGFDILEYLQFIYELHNSWLCHCGEFVVGCHCPRCYTEAPWGCDCGLQEELREEEEDYYDADYSYYP